MNPGFVCAPEMLPVPRLRGLSQEQIAGKACVWCGCSPDDRTVLGPRISPWAGTVKRWFPSACQPCTGRKAVQVYRRHATTCARCVHRDPCLDLQALHTLALECR